jgi:DTW domain-containing protein YfiP
VSDDGLAQRICCTACLRPKNACICRWVTPVVHQVDVLILQHPLEMDHAKNTGRLLHLSLPGSRMLTGETFEEPDLRAAAGHAPQYTVLLYPETLREPAPAIDMERLVDPAGVRMVVLDATWRKSRKMLHLNPFLGQLPRLTLEDMSPSRYVIRQAPRPGQLSTLEAACTALAQLEGDVEKYLPLRNAFGGFVAQQMALSGWLDQDRLARPGRVGKP